MKCWLENPERKNKKGEPEGVTIRGLSHPKKSGFQRIFCVFVRKLENKIFLKTIKTNKNKITIESAENLSSGSTQ